MTEHIEQPTPAHRAGVPSIQAAVRNDLVTREQVGVERYGTPLQPHNGRDALRDAYEEALDLTCYLRQAIAERVNGGGDLWTCSACAHSERFDGDTVPTHDGEHGRCRNSGAVRCPTCRAIPRPWEQPCPTCRHDGVIRRADDDLIATSAWPHALAPNDPVLANGATHPVSITVGWVTFGAGLLNAHAFATDPGNTIGEVLESAARSLRGATPTPPGATA